MSEKRLIDANALIKGFEDAGLGDHSLIESVLAAGVYAGIENAPTIDAVPFEMFADACKHANISCVDPDNRVFDRVCLHTRPKGKSWGTCSFETCPIIAKMDGGAE